MRIQFAQVSTSAGAEGLSHDAMGLEYDFCSQTDTKPTLCEQKCQQT